MNYRVDVLLSAEADILDAAEWYEAQRPGLSVEFTAEIRQTILSLSENPLLYRVQFEDKRRVRWIYSKRFPHRIQYYIDGKTVKVFAVVHSARRDSHWKNRL